MKLTEELTTALLAGAEGWKLQDEKWIMRKYRFGDFMAAVQFVNRVAEASERLNHHPFIAIDYRLVTLRMTSWHTGSLTELDFIAAGEFNRLYRDRESRGEHRED